MKRELMARLEGIVQPDDVVSHVLVDLPQMQRLGLPYTRPMGALVMVNESGTGLRFTYAMELDESPEDAAGRLPVFRSDGWPDDDGWAQQTRREWTASVSNAGIDDSDEAASAE